MKAPWQPRSLKRSDLMVFLPPLVRISGSSSHDCRARAELLPRLPRPPRWTNCPELCGAASQKWYSEKVWSEGEKISILILKLDSNMKRIVKLIVKLIEICWDLWVNAVNAYRTVSWMSIHFPATFVWKPGYQGFWPTISHNEIIQILCYYPIFFYDWLLNPSYIGLLWVKWSPYHRS